MGSIPVVQGKGDPPYPRSPQNKIEMREEPIQERASEVLVFFIK